MLQGILSTARIHGVAVRQERLSTQLLYHIGNRFGVVRAKIADVAQLTEMHLDGNKFTVHVQISNAGLFDEFFQLGGQAVTKRNRVKIGKIYFRFFHGM